MNGIKKRTRTGFSLFEVIVTMTIIAIFLAAATNVFTKRYKKRVTGYTHGRIECYYNKNGDLWQRQFTGSRKTYDGEAKDEDGNENPEYCAFTPPKGAAYLVINTVGGGGSNVGSAGEFKNTFVNVTSYNLRLYPGNALGMETYDVYADGDGGDSYVEQEDDDDPNSFNTIIEAEGGRGNSGKYYYITDCSVSYTKYTCPDAECTVYNDDREVTVRYCTADNVYKTTDEIAFDTVKNAATSLEEDDDIDISDVMLTYNYSAADSHSDDNTILYFTIAFRLDGNFTDEREESGIEKYIAGLDIHDGIGSYDPDDDSEENSVSDVWAEVSPGSGGTTRAGGTGAVLIVW